MKKITLLSIALLALAVNCNAYVFKIAYNTTTTPLVAGSASAGHILTTNSAQNEVVCAPQPAAGTDFYFTVGTDCPYITFRDTYSTSVAMQGSYTSFVTCVRVMQGINMVYYTAESLTWYVYKATVSFTSAGCYTSANIAANCPTFTPTVTTNTRTIQFVCGVQSNADVMSLSPSIGTLNPAFNASVVNYTITLPYGTPQQAGSVGYTKYACTTASSTNASDITGTLAQRTATISTTSYDATISKVYTVVWNITPANTNNYLSALTTTPTSTLSPTFTSTVTNYSVTLVAGSTGSYSLTPTLASGFATIGSNVPASDVTGTLAQRTATVVVNSQGGVSRTYTVIFTVAGSAPTAPSGLTATASTSAPNKVTLNWVDNATNETSYQVFRGGVSIATLAANTTTYVDNNVAYATTYGYVVKAINTNGTIACPAVAVTTMNAPAATGVDELIIESVKVYPNPVVDYLTINFTNASDKTVNIYSINGALMNSIIINDVSTQINFESLISGIYIVQVIEKESKVSFKIVK